jgi:membrane fusion protein, multidrug efflux system
VFDTSLASPPSEKVNVPRLLRRTPIASGAAVLLLALALSGCGKKGDGARGQDSRPKAVGFIVVQQTDVPVETELPGRTNPYRTSEVRPQITGIIRRRLFTEGALVHAGQSLYEIDARPYQAAFAEASANLSSAIANEEAARAVAERYKPLAAIEAVSKQDYSNAVGVARQASAGVAQRRAQLDTARINLRYTSVPAPITGRIGRSLVTDGGLVTANQATAIAQINQLDPIYVDIQQSAAQLIAMRRAFGGTGGAADVRLRLEDGSDYGVTGKVKFTDTIVDESTGTVTLRAEFANPDGLLLPGMFVRARFAQAVDKGVFLVPQTSVQRNVQGEPLVWIAGPGDKAERRNITVSRTDGTNWVVTSGLKAGEHVLVQGIGSLKPGQAIKPVPADTPQRVGPPRKDGAGRPGQSGPGR